LGGTDHYNHHTLRRSAMPPAKQTVQKRGSAKMSAAHKSALAEGREASRHVRAYLDALEDSRPRRGRRLDPASVKKRIELIDENLKSAGGFERLNLLADKDALKGKLAGSAVRVDLSELRKNFVAHAKWYGERKNISYATWRAAGVSAEDLKAAGIGRARI
jgi:hypothetical protein